MKKLIHLGALILSISTTSSILYAQPHTAQWSFYLAFEDGTGAKDTMWFAFDETSTSINAVDFPYDAGLDGQFGEFPIALDDSTFQVWITRTSEISDQGVSTYGSFNVLAVPWAIFEGNIHAHNYELPIVVRWDTTGYHDQILYDLAGSPINGGSLHNGYLPTGDNSILLETDSIVFPIIEQPSNLYHFPLFVSLVALPGGTGVNTRNVERSKLKVYPNPANAFITIEIPDGSGYADEISVHDLTGRLVLQKTGTLSNRVDISSLPPGMYLVQMSTNGGVYSGKVVVER